MTFRAGPLVADPMSGAPTQCDPDSHRAIARILHDATGISLPEGNGTLIVSRLIRHLRRLNLPDYAAYVRWISDPANAADRAAMITSLTTNTTHFFREGYHFDIFARDLLPDLRAEAEQGGRIRLWSAGCSSGEEVYSLAATLLHHWPEADQFDLRILATDISDTALETASRATYPRAKLEPVPAAIRALMESETSPEADMVQMPRRLRDLVTVRHLNFVEPWPTRGPYQAILCRNVAIYMDQRVQTLLFTGLADRLAPGGLLFIGHSERLPPSLAPRLKLIDRTTFRNVGS